MGVENMKKMIIMIMMALTLVGSALAAGDNLSPLDTTMAQDDVQYVDYCVFDASAPNNELIVFVNGVCEDYDGYSGCSVADDSATTEFSAVAVDNITLVNGAGCTDIMLTTSANASGLFYYTVNGDNGGVNVLVSETGSVLVPEFGVLASLGILAAAGIFIYRKRK